MGVPTKVVCAECMKMFCLGGKNSVVKGLISYIARACKNAVVYTKSGTTVKARTKRNVERKQEMQTGNTSIGSINAYRLGHTYSLQLPL